MGRKIRLSKPLRETYSREQLESALEVSLKFLHSLQGRNMIIDPKRYIIKQEGISYDQFIEQLVYAALSLDDPMEGLVAYWKEILYPYYGTHRTRPVLIDSTLASEKWENPLETFLGFEGRPPEGPSPSLSMSPSRANVSREDRLYRQEYGQRDMWPQERKDVIYTWLVTGSVTETAELLGLPYKKVANATERIGSLLRRRAAREGLIDIQGEPTEEMIRCCRALVEYLQE